jgi:replicative DNA helicase
MKKTKLDSDMIVPTATEAERGIASVALNHPKTVLNYIAEKRFQTSDIFEPTSRAVVEIVIHQNSRGASCDARVIFEKLRERMPETTFAHLTDLYTLMPIEGALPELLEAVRNCAKRRALQIVAHEALNKINKADVKTTEIVNDVAVQVDSIQTQLSPPAAEDTKTMLLAAITRYQTGDDSTQRIKTGYEKLDNLTPIRYGDFLVIGGETKSGKTMLALNIVANLL